MQSLQEMLELVKDSVDGEVPVDTQKFLKQLLSKCNLDSVNALQSVVSDLHDFSEAVQELKHQQEILLGIISAELPNFLLNFSKPLMILHFSSV